MTDSSNENRSTMILTDVDDHVQSFAEDVNQGLSASPKYLSCIYFYDYEGSLLFEKICQLPEYYLTRTETGILKRHAEDIISHIQEDTVLVELGSGSSIKTCYIIEEFLVQHERVTYSPIDISRKMLKESSRSLLEKYDDLHVVSVAAEYEEGLKQLDLRLEQTKLILWLGSSIGNFQIDDAIGFLQSIRPTLTKEDYFLVGFDLDKDPTVIEAAYNDSQGVTAAFNLNLLSRINKELGGQFQKEQFLHEAIYNRDENRIEMYLKSSTEQDVFISDLNQKFHFNRGERIHTENSYKFTLDQIENLAVQVGLDIVNQWFDDDRFFNLTLFQVK